LKICYCIAGFQEILKVADAPGSSRSMHIALADLGLEQLWVVYPGDEEYELAECTRHCRCAGSQNWPDR
jgi:hypothetical protein